MEALKTIAVAAVATALLASCGGGPGGSSSGRIDSINLWVPPLAANTKDAELWADIVKPFEKKNKVDVKVTVISWDTYESKYLTGMASKDGPDVGYMYGEMMGDYIAKNQLVDLSGMVTQEQKDNLLFLDKGKVNGKQYSLPLVVGGARVLFYNKGLFAKAHVEPPKTWDDFLAISKILKAKGIQPFTASWGDPARGAMNASFIPWLLQSGGSLFAEDGSKTAFDTPEAIETATFIKQLHDEEILPKDTTGLVMDQSFKQFTDGKAAMMIDTEQDAPRIDKAGVKWGYVTSLKKRQQGTMIAADALVMTKRCKVQKTCYDLMTFVESGKQMTKLPQAGQLSAHWQGRKEHLRCSFPAHLRYPA